MLIKGIFSDNAPKAVGPYSPGIQIGDMVYLSGQIPSVPDTNEIVSNDIKEQTQQVINNMMAVLAEMDLELRHVVKTTVFMKDLSMFADMNEVYALFFEEPYPARSCIEVAKLPKDALVEIEAVAINTLRYESGNSASACGGCSGCVMKK